MNVDPPCCIICSKGDDVLKSYEIMMGGHCVGIATVMKQGLYYQIKCKCSKQAEGMCKILVSGDVGSVNLGACYPTGTELILEKRIPVKHIGAEPLQFWLQVTGYENVLLVPLRQDEAFTHIADLRNARLVCGTKTYCMVIRNRNC